jgi:hypothetical protein
MRGRRALVATGVVGVVLAAGSVWFVQRSDDTPPSTHDSSIDVSVVMPGRYVYVESGEPRTKFLPLGPGPVDRGTLSAQRAYNLLVSDSAKLQLIPAAVQPYYGVLTDASASPMALHTLVWGFATVSGCVVTGGGPAPGHPTPSSPPAQRCRIWEFVNARSGHDLGVITQEVLPD